MEVKMNLIENEEISQIAKLGKAFGINELAAFSSKMSKGYKNNMSTKFYHYTSIDTLYNMLEKSIEKDKETSVDYLKLWATNIDYMNDRTERKLFTDALI